MSYIKKKYVCYTADVIKCGIDVFGIEWNDMRNIMSDNELYGQDGDGCFIISHSKRGAPFQGVIQKVIDYILDEVGITEVEVIDCQ